MLVVTVSVAVVVVISIAEAFALDSLADGQDVGFVFVKGGVAVAIALFFYSLQGEVTVRLFDALRSQVEGERESRAGEGRDEPPVTPPEQSSDS